MSDKVDKAVGWAMFIGWLTARNIVVVAVLLLVAWYLLDGRYSYRSSGGTLYRMDHLLGEQCFKTYNGSWIGCK
jgi:hypothetical protein